MYHTLRAAFAAALLIIASLPAAADLIDFETTPAGGTPVDDAPLSSTYTLSGGGTVAFYFDVNGNYAFDPGTDARPSFEAYGPDSLDGFASGPLNTGDIANGGTAGQLGNFFLRQLQPGSPPPPFIVDYNTSQVISALLGEIWDIDGDPTHTEQWLVQALDGSNNLLASVTSPLGDDQSLDGLPWVFSFSGLASGFDKLKITFTGSKTSGLGLAFNNFNTNAVPEPGSVVLFGVGMVVMAGLGIRRRRKTLTRAGAVS